MSDKFSHINIYAMQLEKLGGWNWSKICKKKSLGQNMTFVWLENFQFWPNPNHGISCI